MDKSISKWILLLLFGLTLLRAPGAQAAVAAIGEVGYRPARTWLERQVVERAPLGVEAALALGRLPASESVPLLSRTAADRYHSTAFP